MNSIAHYHLGSRKPLNSPSLCHIPMHTGRVQGKLRVTCHLHMLLHMRVRTKGQYWYFGRLDALGRPCMGFYNVDGMQTVDVVGHGSCGCTQQKYCKGCYFLMHASARRCIWPSFEGESSSVQSCESRHKV